MKPSMFSAFVFAVLISACFIQPAYAQTFEYKDGRKLEIEFVQEPPCPVKISVKSVNLKPVPDAQQILLQIENLSGKSVRAYAMISGGNRYPNVHSWVFPAAPFESGKTSLRGVWPNSQDHYYFFFDYILFTDGTTCGYNNHHRSIQIASYLESHAAATARLREFAALYPNSEEIIANIEKRYTGGYFSQDKSGPPNPETIKSAPRRAYEHVIAILRQLEPRKKDALELAEKLEKEMPR